MDAGGLTSVDLLGEIRAALDGLEPLLLGRTIDIEMSRLRVLADPPLLQRVLAELIGHTIAPSGSLDPITVRVTRTKGAARLEVINEAGDPAGGDLLDLAQATQDIRAMGGEIGTGGSPASALISWITLPLAPGASSAADA